MREILPGIGQQVVKRIPLGDAEDLNVVLYVTPDHVLLDLRRYSGEGPVETWKPGHGVLISAEFLLDLTLALEEVRMVIWTCNGTEQAIKTKLRVIQGGLIS